jgi:uncharacterized Rmd1/YagE family protein
VQLLIEDVTLLRAENITLHIRFKGGTTQTRNLPLPQKAYQSWQTDPKVVTLIDELLNDFTNRQIADRLNAQGLTSGKGGAFTRMTVYNICQSYDLQSRFQRLRDKGLLTNQEMRKALGVTSRTVEVWRRRGVLIGYAFDDRGGHLYEPLQADKPGKWQGVKLSDPRHFPHIVSQETKEV